MQLVTAVLVEHHDEWAVAERRHLSEESMAMLDATIDQLDELEEPVAITA